MDKIILGILILKRLTAYEIRNVIRQNYTAMCSDSLGSIQVTLKKLLAVGFVTCTEYMENGINKKQYAITDSGRKDFMDWLKTPLDMSKTKNMDLGKLLMMGLIPEDTRLAILDKILQQQNKELEELLKIQKRTAQSDSKKPFIDCIINDAEYLTGLKTTSGQSDITKITDEISFYQNMTLQYGIDSTRFYIEWFSRLRDIIKAHSDDYNSGEECFSTSKRSEDNI